MRLAKGSPLGLLLTREWTIVIRINNQNELFFNSLADCEYISKFCDYIDMYVILLQQLFSDLLVRFHIIFVLTFDVSSC